VIIYGDGCQHRDFIYVDDIANGVVDVLEVSSCSPVLNLGTGVPCSFNSLLSIIREVSQVDLNVSYVPAPPGYPRTLVADVDKANRDLGWSASTTLEEGVACILSDLARALGE
jgi:nucleoside-diphosphate-sugar epimerase